MFKHHNGNHYHLASAGLPVPERGSLEVWIEKCACCSSDYPSDLMTLDNRSLLWTCDACELLKCGGDIRMGVGCHEFKLIISA